MFLTTVQTPLTCGIASIPPHSNSTRKNKSRSASIHAFVPVLDGLEVCKGVGANAISEISRVDQPAVNQLRETIKLMSDDMYRRYIDRSKT